MSGYTRDRRVESVIVMRGQVDCRCSCEFFLGRGVGWGGREYVTGVVGEYIVCVCVCVRVCVCVCV